MHGVGMCLTASDQGCLIIAQMESGGSASRSGVCMVGDELLKIDGIVVEKAPLGSIPDRIHGRAGTTISLTLRRSRDQAPMVYEIELVRGDVEFMALHSRNKVLSRENAILAAQIDDLNGQVQEKEARLGDMVKDINNFKNIATRAQETQRYSEEQRKHAEAEASRLRNAQKNIDEHVNRLAAELREKEQKLREHSAKCRSRSTSPVPDTSGHAQITKKLMGDASVPLNYSAIATPAKPANNQQAHGQMEAELIRTLVAKNEVELRLEQQCVLTRQLVSRCQELELELKQHAADLKELQSSALQVRAAEKRVVKAESARDDALIQMSQSVADLEEHRQLLQHHAEANACLKAKLSQTQIDLEGQVKMDLEALDDETKQLKIKLLEKEAQLKDATERINSYSVRNDITMEGYEQLQKQYTNVQNELTGRLAAETDAAAAARLEKEVVQHQLDIACKAAAAAKLEKEVVQSQLDVVCKRKHELESINHDLHVEIAKMELSFQQKNAGAKEEFESMTMLKAERAELIASVKRLELQLENSVDVAVCDKVKIQELQRQVEQLQHELALVCLCIVTHDIDLATLISNTEPPEPLGEAASCCKLYTREIYQHTLGILRDAKSPRKLLTQEHVQHGLFARGAEKLANVDMVLLQNQVLELQSQMLEMQHLAIEKKANVCANASRTTVIKHKAPTRKAPPVVPEDNNCGVNICMSSTSNTDKFLEELRQYEDISDKGKENLDRPIPNVVGNGYKEVRKVEGTSTRALAQDCPTTSPPSAVRTEHQVISSIKPTQRPLVLATQVVHKSPPTSPTDDPAAAADTHDDWQVSEMGKSKPVSQLKAKFEGSNCNSELKPNYAARAENSQLKAKLEVSKCKTDSKSSPASADLKAARAKLKRQELLIKEQPFGDNKENANNSHNNTSTKQTEIENKLFGPLFASHKTGAELLKSAVISPRRTTQRTCTTATSPARGNRGTIVPLADLSDLQVICASPAAQVPEYVPSTLLTSPPAGVCMCGL
jgi:hypothetical protein